MAMVMSFSVACKLACALALLAAICASACAKAPRRSVSGSELRRLVVSALGLYAVGGLASLTNHPALAGLVDGAGIVIAALAAWLSRGRDEEPPGGEEPVDEQPPPEPDGVPRLDWVSFEREFREYSERVPEPSRPA
jgi:hypothetical protein